MAGSTDTSVFLGTFQGLQEAGFFDESTEDALTVTDVTEVLLGTFISAIPQEEGGDPAITLENELFDPAANQVWYSVRVSHDTQSQETLGPVGTRRFLNEGRVLIEVNGPLAEGAKVMLRALESFRNLAGRCLGEVIWLGSLGQEQAERTEVWYKYVFSVPYRYNSRN